MIILDTHLWIWLADENEQLTEYHRDIIEEERPAALGVSADQIIVATAREYDCELLTVDRKILQYTHVKTR